MIIIKCTHYCCMLSKSFIKWGWAQQQWTAVSPDCVQYMGSLLPPAVTISMLTRKAKIKICTKLESSFVIIKRIREQNWCEQKSVLEGYSHYLSIICLVILCLALTPTHFSKPVTLIIILVLCCYQTSFPLGKVYQLQWTLATVLHIKSGNSEIKTVNHHYPLHISPDVTKI